MNSLLAMSCRRLAFAIVLGLLLTATTSCSRTTVTHSPKLLVPAVPPPVQIVKHAPILHKNPVVLPPIAFPDLDTDQISSLTFSPDGRRLAFGYGADAGVSLWNLESAKLGWQRHINAADGGGIQFTPEGRYLIAQFSDPDSETPTIVCDLDGQLVRRLPSFMYSGSATLEQSGHYLVVGGSQNNAVQLTEVWNTHNWKRVDHISIAPVGFVPLTSSGKIIRHSSSQKIAKTQAIGVQPAGPWMPPSALYSYTDHNAENIVCVNQEGKGIEVWSLRKRKLLWKDKMKGETPRAPAISPNGKILAIGTFEGGVYFWNLKNGLFITKMRCSTDVLRCLTFSPNGRILAAAGGYYAATEGVRLIEMAKYRVIASLKTALSGSSHSSQKDWSLNHPDWLTVLPDLSYIASDSVVKKIRTPGKPRSAATVRQFNRPRRVRAALRLCYAR